MSVSSLKWTFFDAEFYENLTFLSKSAHLVLKNRFLGGKSGFFVLKSGPFWGWDIFSGATATPPTQTWRKEHENV